MGLQQVLRFTALVPLTKSRRVRFFRVCNEFKEFEFHWHQTSILNWCQISCNYLKREMVIVKTFNVLFSFLKRLYKEYPKSFSFIELMIYCGIFFFSLWIVPFWFWHEKFLARLISSAFGLSFFIVSSLIRQDGLKELGIRLDNIYQSGRECVIICFILTFVITFDVILHFDNFSFDKLFDHSFTHYLISFFKHALLGISQQFFLQSVVLIRIVQIFRNKSISLLSTAMLFSLAHSPNIILMIFTYLFGFICCILFLRNRNIFALGIMHCIVHMASGMVFSLFLAPGFYYYDFKKSVGPAYRGDTLLIAYIGYKRSNLEANPSEKIIVPIFVINKSTAEWDSKDKKHPVFISYHILDEKKHMLEEDNIRTPFNKIMKPGDSAIVDLIVYAPPKKGKYYLEVDIVKERIAWFSKKGGLKTILIPLSIN